MPTKKTHGRTTQTDQSPEHPRQFLPSTIPTQQCRTFLKQFGRQSQSQQTNLPSKLPPANLQLTNLPYFIRRTPSNQLPVYLVTKAGGTKRLTKLQKTEGDLDALRSDLALFLGLESREIGAPESPDVVINRLTGHILIKVCSHPFPLGAYFQTSYPRFVRLTYRMTGLAEKRDQAVPVAAQLLNYIIKRTAPSMNI